MLRSTWLSALLTFSVITICTQSALSREPQQTPATNQNASARNGGVAGTVKDATGAVLPGARVVLQPTGTSTATNALGEFLIQDVKPGTYTITISDVGFKDYVSTLVVSAGQSATANPTLHVSDTNQEVVVTANVQGDVAAINEQRTSENILNVMTADTIQDLPNQSVATVLGRMPGVTVQVNEGEPQYVQIRGTEPRLSNTTLDGVSIPGPDPDVRQVDLWVIPGDLMGSIDINKTLSANQDGDAIGGSVNLHMRQATSSRPTLDLESLGGYNPIDTGQQWFRDDATVGKRFGPHERFGVMFSYSYDLNDIGTDDVEPQPDINPDGTSAPYYDNISERLYFYNHTRYGLGGSLDYKVSESSDLFAHGMLSNFRDFGQKFEYDIGNNANGNGGVSFSNSLRRPNYQIADLLLGGNHVFTHSYVHYVAAISHSRFGGAAGNPGADFDPLNGNLGSTCNYVPGPSIYRPQFPCAANDPIYDPTQYYLNDANLTSGQSSQLNLQASGSIGLNYHLGSHSSTFEFGGLIRNAHKGQYAFSPTYDCNPQTDDQVNNGTSPCGANPTLPLMSQFTTTFTDPNYYGGSYKYGPITSFEAVEKWLAANPGVLPLDEPGTHLNSDPANYNLQERITAGYIMNTADLGSKWHLQTGLRFEATNESNTGYLVTDDLDGIYIATQAVNGGGSYINALPSVQLRYNIDTNSDIRVVFGMGISRPDPYDLVPYKTLDESTQPNTESIGNPALVAEHADDYDVLYERFLPSVGMIEAGYFYKHITRPLFQTETIVPNPFPNPITPTVYLNQWINGDHADVQGIELAYQQHLRFLPGVLSNAQIDANFTWTQSSNYNVPNRTDTPPLVGQAPFSYNITPTYVTKHATVSVGISYDGPNIAAYQWENTGLNPVQGPVNGPFGDNYYYERTQVDAQASYYIGKGFTLTASEENANNAVLGFYNGSKQYMTQREYYKPIYYGGLRWSLGREK